MYNTIEVMLVKIESVKIRYATHRSATRNGSNPYGRCHVKVLPYLSVVQSVEGSYDIRLGDGPLFSTGAGGFFVAPANLQQTIYHNVDPQTDTMRNRWVFLDVRINHECALDDLFSFPTILPEEAKGEMNELFDLLFSAENVVDEKICYYRIVKLLLEIGEEQRRGYTEAMIEVLAYVRRHYAESIGVKELAERARMSESNLHATFKKQLGVSPISYLNSFRLSLAEELLMDAGKSIKEVGEAVGIPDPFYFSKLFKRAYGTSPQKYRAIFRGSKKTTK